MKKMKNKTKSINWFNKLTEVASKVRKKKIMLQ